MSRTLRGMVTSSTAVSEKHSWPIISRPSFRNTRSSLPHSQKARLPMDLSPSALLRSTQRRESEPTKVLPSMLLTLAGRTSLRIAKRSNQARGSLCRSSPNRIETSLFGRLTRCGMIVFTVRGKTYVLP